MKDYWKFADEWKIVGVQGYFGPAIISRNAIYLIPYRAGGSESKIVAGALGGIVGGLIAFATTSKPDETGLAAAGASLLSLKDVDNQITRHRHWPVKKFDDERVIVIPREMTISWKFPWWTGLTINLLNDVQIFFSPSIRQWTVRKYFNTFGYPKS